MCLEFFIEFNSVDIDEFIVTVHACAPIINNETPLHSNKTLGNKKTDSEYYFEC